MRSIVERLVSGGQTGVDRAALDVALERGISCGGWCPKGRRAADGVIPGRYPLQETPSATYPQRTEWNVRDSDGTLVITWGEPSGGTALTLELAERLARATLEVDLRPGDADPERVRQWIHHHAIRVLNVAGPRESESGGIYARAVEFLRRVLDE